MNELIEWLEESIESMQFVKDLLDENNPGFIEANHRQKTYQEVLEKIKD